MDMNTARRLAAQRANSDSFKETYFDGIRCKGFRFNVPNGNSNFSLDLSGMGKYFKGIAFFSVANPNLTCQLVINNDVVIENADARFFEINQTNPRDTYIFGRALNGQDTINLSFQNANPAIVLSVLVYYY